MARGLVTLEVEELVLLDLSIFVNNADLVIAALVLLSMQNNHPTVSTNIVEWTMTYSLKFLAPIHFVGISTIKHSLSRQIR